MADFSADLVKYLSRGSDFEFHLATFPDASSYAGEGSNFRVERVLRMDMTGAEVASTLAGMAPSLLHVQISTYLYPCSFDTFPIFLKHGFPLVTTAHDAPGVREFKMVPQLFPLYRRSKAIITHSRWVARALVNFNGVNRRKIHVIPHGVDLSTFSPTVSPEAFYRHYGLEPGPFNVMQFGFVGSNKGTELLFEAVRRISQARLKNMRLIIAGGPRTESARAYESHLHDLSHEMGIDDSTFFTGYVPPSILGNAFSAADLVVLPYLSASQSGPLHRGLAAGKAMIVSDLPSFLEVITDQYNGYVVKRGDLQALTEAIERLEENDELRRGLGAAARRYAEANLDWSRVAELTRLTYREVLESVPAA